MSNRSGLKILCAAALAAHAIAAYADQAKPQYGAWGYDSAGTDKNTKPGDDFFRYANGAWLDRAQIPADKPAVSLRLEMTDRTEGRLHDMMEAAAKAASHQPADLSGKMGAFYKAFTDEGHIDSLGAKPLDPLLADVKAAKSRDALAALMGRTNSDFEGSLFNLFIDVDLKDPKKYALYVSQGGLGLPDRDYYLKTDAKSTDLRNQYQRHVQAMFALLASKQNRDSSSADAQAQEYCCGIGRLFGGREDSGGGPAAASRASARDFVA